MKIRSLKPNDVIELETDNLGFEFPNLNNPLYFAHAAVTNDDDELIGVAFLHLTTEATLVWANNISNLDRSRAVKILIDHLTKVLFDSGLEDTHVFLTNEAKDDFEKFLSKHFGFVRATGTPLYFQLGVSDGKGTAETSNEGGGDSSRRFAETA